jgi:formylglycine-generating enzyme required for sulfatase activity
MKRLRRCPIAMNLENRSPSDVPRSILHPAVRGGLAALVLAAATATAEAPPGASSPADEWAAAMLTQRIALQANAIAAESPWHTTGALKARAFSDVLFPEQGVDLEATRGNRKLWREVTYADGVVHHLQAGDGTATYLYRTLLARKASPLRIGLGSDDGIEFWFNGEKQLSKNPPRGVAAEQDVVNVTLRPGTNTVLLKIYNQTGACGFYYHTGSSPAAVLAQMAERYPAPARWFSRYAAADRWFASVDDTAIEQAAIAGLLQRLQGVEAERQQLTSLVEARTAASSPAWLKLFGALAAQVEDFERAVAELDRIDLRALRAAVEDLARTYPEAYGPGADCLQAIDAFEQDLPALKRRLADGDRQALGAFARFERLQREALLANPLLDFERLLVVKRSPGNLGLPQNWQGNCALPRSGYDNEIAVLSPVRPEGELTCFYRPDGTKFVGDVELNFAADKLLFSSLGKHDRWHVFEIGAEGRNLRQLSPEEPDVDAYDPCYLPDGRILFASTACFAGVPCVGGGNTVANLYRMDADGRNIRQLCFDQDHNWCPTVMNDGRVLYSRWEYSDSPHYFTRLLFRMNPDGTGQMEYYGSSSYWPNSTFYARPIPGHPTQVIAVISGHHGVPRMGELILFEPAKGRFEGSGAVQRIPSRGQRPDPIIRDELVNGSWPKFLHPYPLSEKYFLVSMQPTPQSLWGIYLVDVFDNIVLLREEPGYALLEPVPFRPTPRPPVIPDRIHPESREAIVYLSDIYGGAGLAGVPRGTVKQLRLYEFHYAYPHMGGHIHIGIDGPWDVHRILGTVPVHADGSAAFKVPANTPLAVQPLDAEGRSLQVMRSWFTAMPGEVLSCAGCHESQNSAAPSLPSLASQRPPAPITPWYGPTRGFSFKREVQPVLDRYCVGCHSGEPRPDGQRIPDFAAKPENGTRNFTPSYLALHPYVRRPGPESDYHLQVPLEWHADTSELIQMLKKGHHNVSLDAEAWDRLYTWIDLNVPDHGTWGEHHPIPGNFHQRRLELRARYANRSDDPEAIPNPRPEPVAFVKPAPLSERPAAPQLAGWPFDTTEAQARQATAGRPAQWQLELSANLALDLTLVPAGSFVMGDPQGAADEFPAAVVHVDQPFYLGTCEVTAEQFAAFDPHHDNGYVSVFNKDQNTRGEPVNRPSQPVVRVSWEQAMAFCQWLSQKSGRHVTLPTEAQWEYACRAGTDTPLSYGAADVDFAPWANLADRRLVDLCRADSPKWIPAALSVDDGATVTQDVGRYQPNAWGLRDLHGNAAEWTLTTYRPYPYAADGRDNGRAEGRKVVRGGSFYDRPDRARSAFRLSYPPWQRVFNVGFRVAVTEAPAEFRVTAAR